MHSKINIKEFKARLNKNTIIGNPNINGTPLVVLSLLYSTKHKFFGRIKANSFEITPHSTFNAIPYKIQGSVSSNSKGTTNIDYIIKPIWFGYLWIRIIPIFFILFSIIMVITHRELLVPLILFDSIFIALTLYNINRIKRRLKQFESDFKELFEIF